MFTDPEDAAEAPFSAALHDMPWLVARGTDLQLLAASLPPSPLPPIGPLIVVSEPPLDEPE